MPILHTCKACGSKVSDADVQAGQAVRKGASIYCSECSQLILEPLQVANKAAGNSPKLAAASKAGAAGRPVPANNLMAPSEDPPTGKHDPLSRNGIEVVEEFEILGGGGDVPDLDKEFSGKGGEEEDEESAIDTNRTAPPARAEEAGGDRGRRGLKSRRPGGASARGSARNSGRPSSMRGGASRRSLNRRAEEAPEPSKDPKEIFFKSSSRNVKAAEKIAEEHENVVDSNILKSIKENQENKRKNGRGSAIRLGREHKPDPSTSARNSRRGSVRTPAQSNNTYIIAGGVAVLVLIVGLAIALSGKGGTRPANKAISTTIEDNQPAGYYAQKARELLDKGDKYAAADMYIRAADAAQRSGDTAEAQKYNQAAYGLKFKTAY